MSGKNRPRKGTRIKNPPLPSVPPLNQSAPNSSDSHEKNPPLPVPPSNQSTSNSSDVPPSNQSVPNSNDPHKWRDAIILLFIETIVIGSLGVLVNRQYSKLEKSSEIKFEVHKGTNDQHSTPGKERLKFLIYNLGEKSIEKVTVSFVIGLNRTRDFYEIEEAHVGAYRESVVSFLYPPDDPSEISCDRIVGNEKDPDYTTSYFYSCMLHQLSPNNVYVLTVILKKKASAGGEVGVPEVKGRFQLRDASGKPYEQHMTRADYIELYITELSILCVVLLAFLALIIWMVGARVLKMGRGGLRLT